MASRKTQKFLGVKFPQLFNITTNRLPGSIKSNLKIFKTMEKFTKSYSNKSLNPPLFKLVNEAITVIKHDDGNFQIEGISEKLPYDILRREYLVDYTLDNTINEQIITDIEYHFTISNTSHKLYFVIPFFFKGAPCESVMLKGELRRVRNPKSENYGKVSVYTDSHFEPLNVDYMDEFAAKLLVEANGGIWVKEDFDTLNVEDLKQIKSSLSKEWIDAFNSHYM